MPLTPQHRRRAPHAAGNHARANADQTLTEVDTRLTKVDKSCQKLSTVNPRHSRAPLRHTPNKPEQIRTNLNKPERRQAPRPDRDTPGSPPNSPKKTNPEHRCRPPAPTPAPLPTRAQDPSFLSSSRHSCPLSVIPALFSSFLRRQEPTSPQYSFPAPFPNSSLPPSRGRLGGGRSLRAFADCSPAPDRLCLISVAPALSIIPAQAGTHLAPILLSCSLPQFIPPPFQGGG